MTVALDLKFLGPAEILCGGQPVKFATRKALALFAYLVIERGPHPREKLMSLLWPESETHLAQSALRNTLARIKEAVRNVDSPLQIDGDRVGFNSALASSLDLERVALAASESTPGFSSLQHAADASRGPFLDGLSLPDAPAFDEWLTVQRSYWGHRQQLVYDRLSLQQLENHQIQLAIETVIRWIVLDHLNETAYQRLMRLHFLHGDRSAALQAYEACRDVLSKELGLAPSAETDEVLAYIRLGQAPAQVAEPDAESREALHIPFVGRANEYQGLVQSFRLAKKGKPQVVVVSGESGIGKTRLSDEFLKWAGTEGADVLRGRAFETSGQLLPYQPVIDALRERLERENAPEDLLDDAWLAELTRILPELRERYPDLPIVSGDDSTARARLFEAIARIAESLSARRPLVWLMDDLQWADKETLELLRYLAHGWRKGRAPILLLILMRGEALGHGMTLRDWMSGLTRDIPITRFALTAMSADDLKLLIASLAGENAPGSSELSAWFTAETAGQPFFLTETLTALDEYGALVWNEGTDRTLNPLATLANLKSMDVKSLAPAIRDVVLSRLEWLSQSASGVLSAAAVIGRNCSFGLLSQVSGTDEQNSLNALDELLSARMIMEVRNEARPYTVSHDRIREVVYAQLSEARQQIFHRRALTALTEQQVPPAELAYHALSAKEWKFAFQHSLNAGDEAMGLSAATGAAQHYETARTLLNEKKAVVDDATRQRLFINLGRANELIGNYAESETDYRTALALAETIQDPTAVARVQYGLGMLFRLQGQVANALDLLVKARDGYELLHDERALAGVLIELGLVLFRKGENEDAQKQLEHGLALARKAGDSRAVALALNNLGLVSVDQGEYAKAQTFHEESLALRRELGDKQGIASSLNNLGHLAFEQGNYETGRTLHEESLALRRDLGEKMGIIASLSNLGNIYYGLGDYAAAQAQYEESLALARELSAKPNIAIALNNISIMVLAQGDLITARTLQEESLVLRREMGHKLGVAYSLGNLADIASQQRDFTAARPLFAESLTLRMELNDKLGIAVLLSAMAEMAVAEDKLTRAVYLAAATETLLTSFSGALQPDERTQQDKTIATVREALGESAFQSAWEAGQRLTMKEAVELALREN